MQSAFEQFQENILRVKDLIGIYNAINSQTTAVVDSSDILRAVIVFSVSALDKFVHDVTRIGMLEIFQGNRPKTDAYSRFQLSMETFTSLQAMDEKDRLNILDEEIWERHSWQSFQRPDKIAEALRLVTTVKLWDELAKRMQMDAKKLKSRLELIVERRDKIAHEADTIPPSQRLPERRWTINYQMTEDAIEFMEKIVKAIYDLLTETNQAKSDRLDSPPFEK